jgi:ABC-2 type transport system ATP-binding protein
MTNPQVRTMSVITVDNLRKQYNGTKAVDGISFEVHEGEIFGFLGPNGAGKTTTIEIIEGYRTPDSGSVTVLGFDPHSTELKEHIGIMLQETALYQDLKVQEVLQLFSSYYRHTADFRMLLEMIGLKEKSHAFIRELSGGQKQRLAFILALLNDPEVLFLDEPTAGLDPQSRRFTWDWISRVRKEGKTVFLTTHYIEEAEALCDRVAIIDFGKIIALDTPHSLTTSIDIEQRIEFTIDGNVSADTLNAIPGATRALDKGKGAFTLYTSHAHPTLKSLLSIAEEEGFILTGLKVEGATLEDVFITLTGRGIRA